ncbi:aldo/keto reductase [Calothrix sp. 336/3]|uniref:aldo/keto reductase n=1 Tax=Calothrix sp. 336/3 TaxID=1337936 RepID=UPI00062486EF|nr:aldo/keto reductase [Calothrix sp. 336/3]AKG22000.1 2,5-didehydrogluconate reductase [Calothrix sp. 336/3]
MTITTLGTTNIAVTPLCIGTWAWGDKLFWNDYDEAELQAAFTRALELGLNFFDTAEIYGSGLSEKFLGKFTQSNTVQIATKFAPLPWRFTGKSVSEALTASLSRLQRNSVALYQVHWSFAFFMSQDTLMNALAEEVQRGRVQAIGVSNYSAVQMQETQQILGKLGIPLAVNQVPYSLLNRQIETNGIVDTARDLGVTILAYSPLAQGLLTGKYTLGSNQKPTGARKIDPRFSQDGLQKITPVISLLKQIGETHNHTPAQVALNWLIAQGNVIPIAGAKTVKQVEENAGALGWQLTPEEISQIDEITRPWRN